MAAQRFDFLANPKVAWQGPSRYELVRAQRFIFLNRYFYVVLGSDDVGDEQYFDAYLVTSTMFGDTCRENRIILMFFLKNNNFIFILIIYLN